jgi:hypothetical protein
LDVIGSHPQAGVAPQQELPPLLTLSAAWPYFSLTTSLMPVAVFSGLVLLAVMVSFYLQI